jgi:hypothetical protein
MGRRIHIVGCAKTGTTLLQRLFCAFEDTHVHFGEVSINDLETMACTRSGTCVTKRSWDTVFSYNLHEMIVQKQMKQIAGMGLELVYITRNREAVLSSPSGPQKPERYDDCQIQAYTYAKQLAFMTRYETIVGKADDEQMRLVQVMGLTPKHLWSSYPDFVPDEAFDETYGVRYSARRIGAEP